MQLINRDRQFCWFNKFFFSVYKILQKKYKIYYRELQEKTLRIYGILHELNNCHKNLHENARVGTFLDFCIFLLYRFTTWSTHFRVKLRSTTSNNCILRISMFV